jgi:hypothetical protein
MARLFTWSHSPNLFLQFNDPEVGRKIGGLLSISPTFYERICANILAQKSSNLKCKYKKASRKPFVQKSQHVECW